MVYSSTENSKVDTILRLPEVQTRTGLSRSSIYNYIKDGSFPKRIHIGKRSVGWLHSEIDSWVYARINASR